MKEKIKYLKLIILIILPLLVGFVSSLITKNAMLVFNSVKKPPLSPPGILFPIVWSILYIMMGISNYLVVICNKTDENIVKLRKKCIIIYIIQLIFNFFWSIIFFRCSQYGFALVWLLMLLILVVVLMINSKKISKTSAYLLIPYIVWMIFATYLNAGVWVLN